jgi:hypothetical protein
MPANYVLLEKITVGAAGASSVTFSGIPQTGYTDLVVKFSGRSARGGAYEDSLKIQFNGDTASNYSSRILQQYNNSASSAAETSVGYATIYSALDGAIATANTFSSGEIYIPNYTSSNAKSFSIDAVSETNGTQGSDDMSANRWTGTAAISSITLFPYFSTFVQYSTFYLYGVAKLGTTPAIVPYATGGDTIMTDGTYWYHAFLSSGTFTPAKALSCDVLQIAGGGGSNQGGGGAGGLRAFTSQSLTTTGYTVTVGAGGTAGSGNGVTPGGIGNNSQFGALTVSTGGGGGNAGVSGTGGAGGSGGGGAQDSATTTGGAASPSGQGNAGGGNGGYIGNPYPGGGGGGAGAVGGNATSNNQAGVGGNGVSTYSSWGSVTSTGQNISGTYWYAGGGGGGMNNNAGSTSSGGNGGGGAGRGFSTAAIAGTANTGGGAGGTGQGGAAGGSGIVIVRYAV